jgi:hypothetical protein
MGVFYKHLPMGFCSTPQGRVIFYASISGAKKCWQGRIPEYVEGNYKFYWHPYQKQWVLCEFRNPETGKFEPTPQIMASRLEWDLPKYRTATHSTKAGTMFGFDAAYQFVQATGVRTGFLMEGPLDAGRFGIPAVAMTGAVLSPMQAMLLAVVFRRIVYCADRGKAGELASVSVTKQLASKCEVIIEKMPEGVSDPGDAPESLVAELRKKYLQ